MKKDKLKNKIELTNNEKLVKMFEDQIPEDRQQVLRDIDTIMCSMLEVELNDLPWINPNKHEEKWDKLMRGIRLMIARMDMEFDKKDRTLN